MTPAEHNETQQPTLKAFLDNELSLWRRFAVRLHLARCASCREELRTMQQIGTELRGQTTIDPLDPGLRSRILAAVREMTPEPTPPVQTRQPVLIGRSGIRRTAPGRRFCLTPSVLSSI